MGVLFIKLLINLNHKYEFWKINEQDIQRIRESLPEIDVCVYNNKEHDIWEMLSQADIYYGWAFPSKWLEASKKLKWIATPSAGADYIASPALEESGILFTTSSGYHGYPMAQHAIGFILGFSRGIIYSARAQTVKQNYRSDVAQEFFDIKGTAMAIIGCGSIGTELGKMSKSLGIKVYGIRRNLPSKGNQEDIIWTNVDRLTDILPECKIVVNLLPKTETTPRFFNKEMFNNMQRGTVFINLGRGITVDEDALLWALDEGIVSWCGLDVLSQEPSPVEHPLKKHSRVVVTPHSASFSNYFMGAAVNYFIEQCKKFVAGEKLNNIVFQ